jgi:gamma-glutamyl hercynylcysteine S-oxide synthase
MKGGVGMDTAETASARLTDRYDRVTADRQRVGDLVEALEAWVADHGRATGCASRVQATARSLDTRPGQYELFGAATAHPDPVVRFHLVEGVRMFLPDALAADTLFALVIDPDDIVCLRAIEVAGIEANQALATYILEIIGPISGFEDRSTAPVGRGAAHAMRALERIYRSVDLPDSAAAEAFFMENGFGPASLDIEYTLRADYACSIDGAEHDDMVLIPGGWSSVGLDESRVPDRMFDWKRSVPARPVWLPPYLIDRYPVTVTDYDAFVADIEEYGHQFCHPLEAPDKAHRRNTFRDDRYGADHPVTGVDWFDAFAYAAWAGKDLPSEYQWEIAARGPKVHVWPWGDQWLPEAAQWAGTVFDRKSLDLREWRSLLAETLHDSLPRTAPVRDHERYLSGYGAVDMVGNCWEWTKSDLASGGPFSPSLLSRRDEPVSVVLKGGSWSSQPGLMFPSFRGQDAPFCRHDEIGFRCVKQVPPWFLTPPEGGRRNSALY